MRDNHVNSYTESFEEYCSQVSFARPPVHQIDRLKGLPVFPNLNGDSCQGRSLKRDVLVAQPGGLGDQACSTEVAPR